MDETHNFFSCYETTKLMDNQSWICYSFFSKKYKFEEDLQFLSKFVSRSQLKEFYWMIKMITSKVYS